MKVIIDIPKEFESDLQDKFNEFFERLIADIDFALEKQEPLLCGNYERETAEMFLKAFEKATVIPDDATNGDVIRAMFPDVEVEIEGKYITLWLDEYRWVDIDYDLWNAPYMKEMEE